MQISILMLTKSGFNTFLNVIHGYVTKIEAISIIQATCVALKIPIILFLIIFIIFMREPIDDDL